jgi:hypothetical protein
LGKVAKDPKDLEYNLESVKALDLDPEESVKALDLDLEESVRVLDLDPEELAKV